MLTYLHDIRNKLTLISGQTTILSKKYGEDDFIPIKTNLARISELINDAYLFLKEEELDHAVKYTPAEFMRQMDLLAETAKLLFVININNEVAEFKTQNDFQIEMNTGKIFQVIENAIDNSIKAGATKLIIRLLEIKDFCIYEIVDNGHEKPGPILENFQVKSSIIPHGIGKEIMMQNMMIIGGKVEWTRRLDYSGMIVRLYFPKRD